jgi:small subunit ribosomal protein S16
LRFAKHRWTGSIIKIKSMATKIRLQRHGRKRKPFYHVVVADARAPRDGRIVEKLGTFNPNVEPPLVELNFDAAVKWVLNGATPTDTARMLLSKEGVMLKKHLQVGVNKGAITQEAADEKFGAWKSTKDSADEAIVATEAKAKAAKDAKDAAARIEVREVAAKALKEQEEAALKASAEEAAAKKAEEAAAASTEEVKEETTEEAAPEASTEG